MLPSLSYVAIHFDLFVYRDAMIQLSTAIHSSGLMALHKYTRHPHLLTAQVHPTLACEARSHSVLYCTRYAYIRVSIAQSSAQAGR
jgi:hypothetical protein